MKVAGFLLLFIGLLALCQDAQARMYTDEFWRTYCSNSSGITVAKFAEILEGLNYKGLSGGQDPKTAADNVDNADGRKNGIVSLDKVKKLAIYVGPFNTFLGNLKPHQ